MEPGDSLLFDYKHVTSMRSAAIFPTPAELCVYSKKKYFVITLSYYSLTPLKIQATG